MRACRYFGRISAVNILTCMRDLLFVPSHGRCAMRASTCTSRVLPGVHRDTGPSRKGTSGTIFTFRAQRRLGPVSGSRKLLIMITGIYSRPAARDHMPPGEALRRAAAILAGRRPGAGRGPAAYPRRLRIPACTGVYSATWGGPTVDSIELRVSLI
jgi:hypothetical protein